MARALIANTMQEYNRLGALISDARIAGLVDWDAIVDRTRNLVHYRHWTKPSEAVEHAAHTYSIDRWSNQDNYVEVWVEKDALLGVVGHACAPLDVPHFSCRGYTSQSEVWAAAQRLIARKDLGKVVHIIHLGDHDPSGIDMSRDIKARLDMFTYGSVHVQRIALNMPQVNHYHPPPNPAKVTDSRFASYQAKYGDDSWELDALDPTILVDTITRAVNQYRDMTQWAEQEEVERRGRLTLQSIYRHFTEVVGFLRTR